MAERLVFVSQVAAVLERRQLQHVLATAMPQLRATTLGSTVSDPAALHRLWGLPQSQTAPSDQVAPHHLAPRPPSSSVTGTTDLQNAAPGSTPTAATAPASFPAHVVPVANMTMPGMNATGPYMRQTHKMFPGAAQVTIPAAQFPQGPPLQPQPMLYPGMSAPPAAPADLSQLSALMHGCPSAVALVDDFEPVLHLAEGLAKSKMQNQNVREFVSWLYSSMFRIYSDERSREHMMNSLVRRATSFDPAISQASDHSAPSDTKRSSDTPNSAGKSKGSTAAAAATAAASVAGASCSGSVHATQGRGSATLASTAQQVHRGGSSGRAAAPDVMAPAGLLMQLVHQHHDAAPTALTLMLHQVQQQHAQVCFTHLLSTHACAADLPCQIVRKTQTPSRCWASDASSTAALLMCPLLQMENYQQQLKEQQGKLQKASKQAQEASVKAGAQQQVRLWPRQS